MMLEAKVKIDPTDRRFFACGGVGDIASLGGLLRTHSAHLSRSRLMGGTQGCVNLFFISKRRVLPDC